jgi:hypothetical protein
MQSFSKKIKTLLDVGIDPYFIGKENFNNPIKEVEDLARERLETCKGCPFFVDEPISFLSVTDINIPELSGKICDECGCTASYKLRQSKSKCKYWKK